MAIAKILLDTRKSSRKSDGTFPICIRVFHKKERLIPLKHYTTKLGWDDVNCKLRKSVGANKGLDCNL